MKLHVHLEDVANASSNPEAIRGACEGRAAEIEDEFPETTRVDVTVHRVGPEHETHVHINGKDLEVASRARNVDVLGSVTDAFEKARRQLRKRRDKQIFRGRRDTQRTPSR
jgi:ribosome-associated translation inhibitor RaiA